MRWNRFRSPLIVLTLTTAGALLLTLPGRGPQPVEAGQDAPPKPAGQSASQAPATSANDAGLRQAVADYVAAIGKGDLDGIMSFWADDADYIAESGTATHGKREIGNLFKQALPDLKGEKVSGEVKSIRMIHPDVAMEEGTIDYAGPDGVKDRDRYSAIWVKTGGKWQITSARDLPSEGSADPSIAYAHLRSLEWLVGDWADEAGKGEIKLHCHWGSNKAFLLMNYEIRRDGQEPLGVTVRVGWDGHESVIRSWVFDSQGGFAEATWGQNGRKWVVQSGGVLPDGGTGSSTNTYEFVDANKFAWRATDRLVDDQPVADVEVRFVRQARK